MTGGYGDERFDTKVCDVTVPFTIRGSVMTMAFTPTGDAAGSAVVNGTTGGATFRSKGTYEIAAPDGFGKDATLTARMLTTVVAGRTMSAAQTITLRLIALDPKEC